jgi:tetratricopeptide (TPR) repeat protein
MNNKLIMNYFSLLIILPSLAFSAPNKPADNVDLQVFKTQTEADLRVIKENQQKDLQQYQKILDSHKEQIVAGQKDRLDAFDKRISDINFYLAIYAILGTIIAIAVSLLALFTAGSKAEESAKNWFKQNENDLRERLKKLEYDVLTHAQNTKQAMTADAEALKFEKENIQQSMMVGSIITASTDNPQLESAANSLKQKPEAQYNFDDWNTRAYAAVSENKIALAAEYWSNAALSQGATDLEIARALYNQGVSLGRLKQYESSIASYSELIDRFGTSTLPAMETLVATALVGKGARYEQLNEFAKAIASYSEVISHFGESTVLDLQIHVARSLVNKGNAHGESSQFKEATASHNEAIRRFGASSEPALQEQVTRAMNSIGYTTLLYAKQIWAKPIERKRNLTSALGIFKNATTKPQGNTYSKAILLGNMAYTYWLLGQKAKAKIILREALLLGNEEFRDIQLKDIEIHRVPPDAGFRDLINKVWQELHL